MFCVCMGILPAKSSEARQICKVNDPTGTPLNIRDEPGKNLVGTLKNGTEIELIDTTQDTKKRTWAKVGSYHQGGYQVWGWVFKGFIKCGYSSQSQQTSTAEFHNLVIPPVSSLHSPKKIKMAGTAVILKGKMWVTGILAITSSESGSPNGKKLRVTLIPDSMSPIPRFIPYEFDIQINDGKKVTSEVFGDVARRISNQQIKTAYAHGRFLITNYETGVICDSGWARGDLLLAEVPPNTIVLSEPKRRIEC
jgi:Bacterial SH3 domain